MLDEEKEMFEVRRKDFEAESRCRVKSKRKEWMGVDNRREMVKKGVR